MSACVFSACARGAGVRSTIVFKRSATPSPVFPDTRNTSASSHLRSNANSLTISSVRAVGASTLETTGIIARLSSFATPNTDSVCASTPCVASTSKTTPSTADSARETSYAKSTWPGVSIRLRTYSTPPFDHFIRTGVIFIVIPLSCSSSIRSSTCSCILRDSIVFVSSSIRSASVLLP